MSMIAGLGRMIDAFRPADGPPPQDLWPFVCWALGGAWPVLALGALISALAGVLEVATALILGVLIDTALEAGGAGLFSGHAPLLLGFVAFFLLLRPLAFGANSAITSVVVAPNALPLVLSRLNRYTLGQSVGFFDDDFAGRIAQKQMQTARALTDVVVEGINTVAFALASLIGATILLVAIDWRIAASLALWLVAYFALIRAFLPRIRLRAAARAEASANVTGQVVDTITNIKTVKLFAHDAHEDRAALDAMAHYRARALSFGAVSTAFRFALMTLAGVLPVIMVGLTLWLWSLGQASAGDIAATGTMALRIAQMTGWVSFTLMTIYANLGEVEDGILTLTPPHALPDGRDAVILPPVRGRIAFEDVSFAYGRRQGGIQGIDLTIAPGEKVGIVGASGAGKSTLVNLLLRLHDPEGGRILIDGQDLRGVTQESLRGQIGMVTQDTATFNRSAFENIRYGRPGATLAEVHAAAARAEAHEFIEGLRDHRGRTGYDAHLGERGVKLSGGQRQRIALA
ncbi:MAG: ABC transporter ATP-binding protein, partial [Rhodobacteraceae bacterium]|nr:ABC transporter ATP-binding protein [Paracoccaceae bacterium]